MKAIYVGPPGDPANGRIATVLLNPRRSRPRHCLVRWDTGEYSSVPRERLVPIDQPVRVRPGR